MPKGCHLNKCREDAGNMCVTSSDNSHFCQCPAPGWILSDDRTSCVNVCEEGDPCNRRLSPENECLVTASSEGYECSCAQDHYLTSVDGKSKCFPKRSVCDDIDNPCATNVEGNECRKDGNGYRCTCGSPDYRIFIEDSSERCILKRDPCANDICAEKKVILLFPRDFPASLVCT